MMPNDALKELLGYRSELLGFVRAILRNPSDAEDLFQETCRIILEKSAGAGPIRAGIAGSYPDLIPGPASLDVVVPAKPGHI